MYIYEDDILIIIFIEIFFFFEIISDGDDVELIECLEIRVDFFPIFEVALNKPMCCLIKLFRVHGHLQYQISYPHL